MKLRTGSKRKPTEELILFKEQAISTKRAKAQPQHEIGYSLRSKPGKTRRHTKGPTDAKISSKIVQTRVLSRLTAVVPISVPVLQRGRSIRLLKQRKPLKSLQKETPSRKQASAALPVRRSLRLGAKCKLEPAREVVVTKRSTRRLIVRVTSLPTCEGSRAKRGDLAPTRHLSWSLHVIHASNLLTGSIYLGCHQNIHSTCAACRRTGCYIP